MSEPITPPPNGVEKPAYHRPNLMWECGRACEGCACKAGPNRWGRCSQAAERCSPKLSLRARRRLFVIACFLFTVGGLMFANNAQCTRELNAPGALTSPHAQILNRTTTSNRCAECHGAGNGGPLDWVRDMLTCGKHCQTTQTELCLKCHQKQIAPEVARTPHNLPLEQLARLTAEQPFRGGRRDAWLSLAKTTALVAASEAAKHDLACSDCHKEHHGVSFDLKAVTDQQCQACHKNQFHSFADGHPEFEFDRLRRRTRIAFDHTTHAGKYFAQKNKTWSCAQCHEDDSTGNIKQLVNYSRACAECHDGGLKLATDTGLAFLSVPTIPRDQLLAAGHKLGDWPTAASGDFDGKLTPFVALLLSADETATTSLRKLAPDFDLSRLDPEKPDDLATGAALALATKRLFADLSLQGEAALVVRLEKALRRPLTADERSRLVTQLPIAMLAESSRRWFPSLTVAENSDGFRAANATTTSPQTISRNALASGLKLKSDASAFRLMKLDATRPLVGTKNASAVRWSLASYLAANELLVENPLAGRAKPATIAPAPEVSPATTDAPQSPNKIDLSAKGSPPTLSSPQSKPPVASPVTPTAPAPPTTNATSTTNAKPSITPPSNSGDTLADNPLRSRRAASNSSPPVVAVEPVTPPPSPPVASTSTPATTNPEAASSPPFAVTPPSDPVPASAESAIKPGTETTPGAASETAPETTPVNTIAALPTPDHWRRDDKTLTIRYQPRGHSDALIVAWLNVALAAPALNDGHKQEKERHFATTALLKEPTIAACVRCHSVDRAGDHLAVNWKTEYRDTARRDFTKFTHRPHAFQPNLQDCRHCHLPNESPGVMANFSSYEPIAAHHDFHPPTKAACASCHNSRATSQSCTLCHRYHIRD